MVRDFGREADELRQAFESAVEHSDLLAIRRVLRDFIELAADNLEQQPETLTAMNTLANVLDDPGTIEMIKRVGVEESPFVMAEQELLERLRELPVNLIMVAPRKLQAVIFVAQRRFDKAVALGEEAAFAVALALRAQMGVRPRRIEQIMAALAGAKQEVVVNALELVNADARAGDFERWDQNLAHWFGSRPAAAVRAGPTRIQAIDGAAQRPGRHDAHLRAGIKLAAQGGRRGDERGGNRGPLQPVCGSGRAESEG